jgi:hypothetical protein
MHRRPITPFGLALFGSLLAAVAPGSASQAQPITRPASNITPYDARSVIAPALPVPPVPSGDPPRSFLFAARDAVQRGHTGEAQEALERAETRLLDGSTPATVGAIPDRRQAVFAVSAARNALAKRDRPAALAAIDSALAATDAVRPRLAVAAPTTTPPPLPLAPPQALPPPQVEVQPQPVITRALLAGHWTLHGARYAWTPPETRLRTVRSAGVVPGSYVWRDGAYVWVPTHYEN